MCVGSFMERHHRMAACCAWFFEGLGAVERSFEDLGSHRHISFGSMGPMPLSSEKR
jgi:hypothetical protein